MSTQIDLESAVKQAREKLDQHTYDIVQRHFHESTGCPFWLGKKAELNFDPLTEVKCYDDLKKFPLFEDDWLRGGPVERWRMKDHAERPTYVFETGGTTGLPKAVSWLKTIGETMRSLVIRFPMSTFREDQIG